MTDPQIIHRLESLTQALIDLCNLMGARLTRAQMCDRLRVSDNTLRKLEKRPGFPMRDATGKYLLADVIAWECNK